MVMLLLPNGQSSQFTFQSLQWETVVYLPIISLLVGLLFTFRLFQSVRSQLFVRHEKQLAETLATQIDEKCQLTDKYHAAKNEYAEMETSLENARLEGESINVLGLTDTYRKLRRVNVMMRQELNSLVQELIKERFMQSKQEEEMEEMLKVLKSLEEKPQVERKEGKEEKKAAAPAPEEELDECEQALAAEPKAKDPFAHLPKSTFVLDEFKGKYSNEDTLSVALPYFGDHFDKDGWSLWYSEYCFPEELTQTFMSCNLITGMFQRLDKLRKNAFTSVILFGANNSSSISEVWVFRGQELALPLSPDWQVDYKSYTWRKLDPSSKETQTLVPEYLCWEGAFQHVGKAFNQGKIFK
ncbi:hypothetical protein G4228_018424 [Cervus hanglu yarkandensis]|nr:hypothetical protein G4228_018424 [Cervus hanglu yarkandensis]